MKKIATILLLASVSLIIAGCSKTDYSEHQGKSGQFSDHRGQWLIINYWATWCKPCIEEIPELNQFAKDHADSVSFFGVDFDQSQGEALAASIEKLGIEFPVLTNDPAATLGFERPMVLPTTLVFNPEGELQHTLVGPQTEQSLAAIIVR